MGWINGCEECPRDGRCANCGCEHVHGVALAPTEVRRALRDAERYVTHGSRSPDGPEPAGVLNLSENRAARLIQQLAHRLAERLPMSFAERLPIVHQTAEDAALVLAIGQREAYAAGVGHGATRRALVLAVEAVRQEAAERYPLPTEARTREVVREVEDPSGGPYVFHCWDGRIKWSLTERVGWHEVDTAGAPLPTAPRIRLWADLLERPTERAAAPDLDPDNPWGAE